MVPTRWQTASRGSVSSAFYFLTEGTIPEVATKRVPPRQATERQSFKVLLSGAASSEVLAATSSIISVVKWIGCGLSGPDGANPLMNATVLFRSGPPHFHWLLVDEVV